MDVTLFPPVKLGDVVDSTIEEPFLVAQWDEEVDARMFTLDLSDGGMGEVVIVVVADYDRVHGGNVIDVAWDRGVSFRALCYLVSYWTMKWGR